MRPGLSFGSVLRVTANATLAILALSPTARGQASDTPPGEPEALTADAGDATPRAPLAAAPRWRIQISDVRLRRAAESAVRAASMRLGANGCGRLLSAFVDQRGQPLTARLETLGMSLQEFLQAVIFVDGSRHRSCQGPVAVTMPGSRVVYLCDALIHESRNDAWVAIVHEVLHALGLGESPPTPAFISDRVREHCRR